VKPERLSLIAKNKNVVFHKRLSPVQYRSTIEQSLFMLLPLKFATANNALLESMSFGVPVYCSDVEGVKDYLISEEYVFRHSKEVMGILDRRLQQSHADAVRERTALKRYARERFGWEKIRNEVIQRATG
jgi:glycosyltransferase involved in cell wall biosynthesis